MIKRLKELIKNGWLFAKEDFKSWPIRFCLELFGWVLSIACALGMALTLPNPPFIILYTAFITQCTIFGWSAWTRKSFSMLANYMILVVIDLYALTKLILLAVQT